MNDSYIKESINNYFKENVSMKDYLIEFNTLPSMISNIEKTLFDMDVALKSVVEEQTRKEKYVYSIVSNELDSNGKPAYSNEEKRKAEVVLRLSIDEEFEMLDKRQKEIYSNIKNLQIENSMLKMKYENMKILLRAQ